MYIITQYQGFYVIYPTIKSIILGTVSRKGITKILRYSQLTKEMWKNIDLLHYGEVRPLKYI